MNTQHKDHANTGLSGVLGALEKLVKLADDLQKAQGEISREGELNFGKQSKVAYRFRMRTLGDLKRESLKSDFKPFEKSATPKPKATDTSRIPTVEPETDVFIEGNVMVIYAQLPGVPEPAISLDAHTDRIAIRAQSETVLYEKNLTLPKTIQPDSLVKSYKNGIFEIRLTIQPNA